MKYIDSEKLIAEIERYKQGAAIARFDNAGENADYFQGKVDLCDDLTHIITALQHEQPIEGKQVVIITETDGDANIHWDCRSLDDARALLTSAESFITDKQIEELRGQGSGPDYNTTEGRFRNAHKFQHEQPKLPGYNKALLEVKSKVDELYEETSIGLSEYDSGLYNGIAEICMKLRKFINARISSEEQPEVDLEREIKIAKNADRYLVLDKGRLIEEIARYFYDLGRARKEQPKLPGIEDPGTPGKDFIPVEWVDACEMYGKWKIVKQDQPEVDIEKEITEHAINMPHCEFSHDSEDREHEEWAMKEFRYFYELGLNARKED